MKTKSMSSKVLMVFGSLVYLIGIWRTCPLFSSKGYFLGALVMGIFAILAHQRAIREERKDDSFLSLCRLVILLAVGLLLVGVEHVPADWSEKAIYVVAWFICLYGASALPSNPNAAPVAQQDSTK